MTARYRWLRGPQAAEPADQHPAIYRREQWLAAVLTGLSTVFLLGPVVEVWRRGNLGETVLIIVITIAFICLCGSAPFLFHGFGRMRPAVTGLSAYLWFAVMAVLVAASVPVEGLVALNMVAYLVMIGAYILPDRAALGIAITGIVFFAVVPPLVPRMGMTQVTGLIFAMVIGVFAVARHVGVANHRLDREFRKQRAELVVAEERNRVARDVHDILGHSLTVITIKTELAQRLIDIDLDRLQAELTDIELLAREALAGVRDTVGGLREITLDGELANARTALSAAGIEARLPADGTVVSRHLRQICGWVLREAVTNVVRHSGAQRCTVTVAPASIDILDDGKGLDPAVSAGSGLDGLHERVAAFGGTLRLGTMRGRGFRLTAEFPYPATTEED
ncbi:sensor histidine kinase [Nocardia sp. NPDC088792]|uniref:sensor histidine kinase n=1 Tax=Nocardia sp. NPDC088792 TaxID=3364332 RepID=UPI0037F8D1FD